MKKEIKNMEMMKTIAIRKSTRGYKAEQIGDDSLTTIKGASRK